MTATTISSSETDQANAVQAVRAFQALIRRAPICSLPFYADLSEETGLSGPHVRWDRILDMLKAWLDERGLPDLTALVVNQSDGTPGYFAKMERYKTVTTKPENWPRVLLEVRRHAWAKETPPTAAEIDLAYRHSRQS